MLRSLRPDPDPVDYAEFKMGLSRHVDKFRLVLEFCLVLESIGPDPVDYGESAHSESGSPMYHSSTRLFFSASAEQVTS